jgi:4-diphosphocytidyl-2-C-methyl-D-erythritol kinase
VNSIVIQSYGKINLGLLVKAKRPDGYHNIETIFVPIKLSDKLRLKKIGQGIIVKIPNNKYKLPKGKTNLAYKAAELFFDKTKINKGVEITIEKHIPVGTGLGGGSSNAAAVLAGLNSLFNKPVNKRDLHNLAIKIGMDVPFFLISSACYATGRGEILKPFEIPKLNIVLYFPDFPIITKWAYSKVKTQKSKIKADKNHAQGERTLTNGRLSLKILRKKLANGDLSDLQYLIQNSFEDLVFAHYPDLVRTKEFFLTHGAYAASLSGSGSAIFGLVDKKDILTLKTALKKNKIKAVFTESISC